jgi:hypothetical protein
MSYVMTTYTALFIADLSGIVAIIIVLQSVLSLKTL